MRLSTTPIERASPSDLVPRAIDTGSVPMQVGAVLVLAPTSISGPAVTDAIDRRTRAIPRLRQRLVDAPVGCGRPLWVDDDDFDIEHHVRGVVCPAPGDEAALLAVAADVVIERLPDEHSPWSVTFVTGLASGATALVAVFHHVLADGIGGLAVLAGLVDGARDVALPDGFPRPRPRTQALLVDVTKDRFRALRRVPSTVRSVGQAIGELRRTATARIERSTLNRPTGPERALAVARVELASVVEVAHAHGATVNDVVLAAVAGALRSTLERRGERTVPEFVMTIPVSTRRDASTTELGNDIGVKTVAVPTQGDIDDRLAETARRRARAERPTAAVSSLLDAVFRLAGRLHLFAWFTNRQRMVHTFVTNLRGPAERLTFLGAEVDEVIPVSAISGNVTVAFAVLSYAGTLAITVVADPTACPDLVEVREALQTELDALAEGGNGATARG
ncbi:MAG: wax ester/triacylglycerol synthase domain-containing protein [Ilumatobacteraceae bacterium]